MKVCTKDLIKDDFGSLLEVYKGVLSTVPPRQRIVVVDEDKTRYCAVMLASFELGLVSVPLAPKTDESHKSFIINHSEASAIIRDGKLSLLSGRQAASPEEHRLTIYTSGTTGSPKGVMLSRENIHSNALTAGGLHRFSSGSHCTPLPLYHVNALCMSLFGCYFADSTLVLSETTSPQAIFDLCLQHECKTLSLVPTLISRLVECAPEWPESLEYIISAAAPLNQRITAKFYSLYGPRLRQGYGLSEATNFSFLMPSLSAEMFKQEMVDSYPPVGIPLPQTFFKIEEQEVCVKGPNVFMGYWRNESATNAVLNDGWLKTGDLGELRGEFLVLRGRKKEIILRGGETLYPADLDYYYTTVGIEEPITVGVQDDDRGEDVGLALEVASPLDVLSAVHRIDWSRQPCSVYCGVIPRTSTGKIQRTRIGDRLISGYLPLSYLSKNNEDRHLHQGMKDKVGVHEQLLLSLMSALTEMSKKLASLNNLKLQFLDVSANAGSDSTADAKTALCLNLVCTQRERQSLIQEWVPSGKIVMMMHLDWPDANDSLGKLSISRTELFQAAQDRGWSGACGWSRLRAGQRDLGGLVWFGKLL